MPSPPEVTIVVPTHFRHGYLRRLIDYYREIPVPIVIADSSHPRLADPLPERMTYLHCKGMEFYPKMAEAVGRVGTAYVAFCGDDDFLFVEGLRECVSFLEANPSYASAQGRYVQFTQAGGKLHMEPAYAYAAEVDVDGATAGDRMRQLFTRYLPLFYCVQKTADLKKALAAAIRSGLKELNLLEVLMAGAVIAAGKHKVLPAFHGAREYNDSSSAAQSKPLEELMHDPSSGYGKLLEGMAGFVVEVDRVAPDLARSQVQAAIDAYLQVFLPSYRGKERKVRRFLVDLVPKSLRRAYRSRHPKAAAPPPPGMKGYPQVDDVAAKAWKVMESFIRSHPIR